MTAKPKGREQEFDPEFIRDISVAVYKARLEDASGGTAGAVARMIKKDGDNGEKLRNRAGSYDSISRAYARYFRDNPV